jgi:hypothetical protein
MDTVSKIGNGKAATEAANGPWDDVLDVARIRKERLSLVDRVRALAAEERAAVERLGTLIRDDVETRTLRAGGSYQDVVVTVYRKGGVPMVDVLEVESALSVEYPEPDDDFDDDTRIGLTALGWATAIPPTANAATE